MRSAAIHLGPLPAQELTPGSLPSVRHGAVCSFIGVVRDHARGRQVVALQYECYIGMAESVLRTLIDEAAAAHDPELAARVVHGYGPMKPGDASVAIHVASAHRDAAFAACRQLIERLKQDAPVWKHETYADGTSAWLPGS